MGSTGMNPWPELIDRVTTFSEDRIYRYTLWRDWDIDSITGCAPNEFVQFIGLNPSTADETRDDPTIRRCRGFAQVWGFGAMCMTNLFAFRATSPKVMKAAPNSIGPDNDSWLSRISSSAGLVIACWGRDGEFMNRDNEVLNIVPSVYQIGPAGYPRHPLYLPRGLKPVPIKESA